MVVRFWIDFFLFQEDIEYRVREKEKSEDLLKFGGLSIWKDGTEIKGQGKCCWRSRLGEMEEQNPARREGE